MILVIIIIYILREDFINLFNNYLGENVNTNAEETAALHSQGAPIRIGLNLMAAIVFILFHKELIKNTNEKKLMIFLTILIFLTLFLVGNFSVFADRVNYYLTPIQIIVFSRLPFIFKANSTKDFLIFSTALSYIIILFVWINYSIHAHAWLPYQNLLFNG